MRRTSRVVTNGTGNVLDDSDFYPYGGERVVSSGSGNRYKFTGKERDSESGLDHFGARYNSFSIGRFMSPDPLLNSGRPSNPQTWNRYAYTLNNPLKIVDPTGLYNVVSDCAEEDVRCQIAFNRNAKQLREALENLRNRVRGVTDSVQKARLEAALKALGTENGGNNVNVRFGALPGSTAGHAEPVVDGMGTLTGFNVTFDLGTISGSNAMAISAAHEGTHIADISDPRNAAGTLSDFSGEYRAYQTSVWAASALGLSSLSFGRNNEYLLWNRSWAVVDDKVLTRFILGTHKYANGQPYKETTPHNPWDD